VYRVEDVVSRRMTPTLPEAFATLAGAPEEGATAEDFGGLANLHIALTPFAPPLEPPPPLLLLLLPPDPQADRANAATAPSTATLAVRL